MLLTPTQMEDCVVIWSLVVALVRSHRHRNRSRVNSLHQKIVHSFWCSFCTALRFWVVEDGWCFLASASYFFRDSASYARSSVYFFPHSARSSLIFRSKSTFAYVEKYSLLLILTEKKQCKIIITIHSVFVQRYLFNKDKIISFTLSR